MEKPIDEMIDFFLFEKGENILVNDISMKAVILDAEEKINEYEDKIIHIKYEIKTGDIVNYRNSKYIIESQIVKNQNSYTARMRKCEYRVAFNWSGIVKWFDCIITSKTVDVDSNKYISFPVNRIKISLKSDEYSNKIDINMRCINTGRAWKVVGLDKTRKGLISLICDLDTITSNDNVQLEIADYYSYVYTLTIDNGEIGELYLNGTVQLITTLKLNGTAIANPTILYFTENADIASVDANGLITGHAIGSCAIIVKWADNETIFDSITINIVDEPIVETYNLELTGSALPDTEIKINVTKTYTCVKRNSKGEVVPAEFIFTYNAGGAQDTKYVYTALNTNQCSIKCLGSTYYTVLRATDKQDNTLFIEKNIKLRSSM